MSESFFSLGFSSWLFFTVRFWKEIYGTNHVYEDQGDGMLRGYFWLRITTRTNKEELVCAGSGKSCDNGLVRKGLTQYPSSFFIYYFNQLLNGTRLSIIVAFT